MTQKHARAEFVSKYTDYSYNRRYTYLTYRYRGHEYTVCDTHNGCANLANDHACEQARIDAIIEMKSQPKGNTIDSLEDFFWSYEILKGE